MYHLLLRLLFFLQMIPQPEKDLRVEFVNGSVRYTTSLWDFGDGNTSSDTNPIHTYTTSGTFDVSLSVTGDGGTDTYSVPVVTVEDVQTLHLF